MAQSTTSGATYPPAPWRMSGGAWIGLFRTNAPLSLPPDLAPLLGTGWVGVALLRYLAGTLHYDELIIGVPARRGRNIGVYVDQIWVNDRESLWGGRQIWGLPKQLAGFDWNGDHVRITDHSGPIATITVDPRMAWLPRVPLPLPVWGRHTSARLLALGRVQARVGRAGMRVSAWSERFSYTIPARPTFALALKPFHLVIPGPTIIGTTSYENAEARNDPPGTARIPPDRR